MISWNSERRPVAAVTSEMLMSRRTRIDHRLTTAGGGPRESVLLAYHGSGAGPLPGSVRRQSEIMRLFCFLAMVCLVSGCLEVGPPYPLPYRPYSLLRAAKSTDQIVVTRLPDVQQGSPKAAGYSLTLTGPEMGQLIDALARLQRSANSRPFLDDSTSPEWQLQCCRGTNVLATAAFSREVLFCDEIEFHSPRELRRLYRRVTKPLKLCHPIGSPGEFPLPAPTSPYMGVRVRRFLKILAE